VQRIVDGGFAFVAALVFGDDFAAADDHDAMNVPQPSVYTYLRDV
jgi:hypothetical protein